MTDSKSTKRQNELRPTYLIVPSPTHMGTKAKQTTKRNKKALFYTQSNSKYMTDFESGKRQHRMKLT